MLHMISILLNLLRLVLWPNTWSIPRNVFGDGHITPRTLKATDSHSRKELQWRLLSSLCVISAAEWKTCYLRHFINTGMSSGLRGDTHFPQHVPRSPGLNIPIAENKEIHGQWMNDFPWTYDARVRERRALPWLFLKTLSRPQRVVTPEGTVQWGQCGGNPSFLDGPSPSPKILGWPRVWLTCEPPGCNRTESVSWFEWGFFVEYLGFSVISQHLQTDVLMSPFFPNAFSSFNQLLWIGLQVLSRRTGECARPCF